MKIQTFTIVVGTEICNASCPYCISKMTPKQGIVNRLQPVNWINFDKACRLAQINNVSTVLLTGKGEPTLYPEQVTEFLKRMKKFDFPIIEIQTNGLVFGEKWKKYEPYLKRWRELGLNTIAFSIVHYEKEKNRKIYTPNRAYMDLGKVIEKLHKMGYSVRLSCIMLKGYIDSVEELKKIIKKAKEWKAEQLTVRGVMAPKKSENAGIYSWTLDHLVSMEQMKKMSKFLEKNADKLMTLEHGGIIYDYDGQNVCLSDCLTIKPNTEDLRQLIFFPDGHLRYDWQYKGAILL